MENKITENTEPLENKPKEVWVDDPNTKGGRELVTPEEAELLKLSKEDAEKKQISDKVLFSEKAVSRT